MVDKDNPFLSEIVERYDLSKNGSAKRTAHLVLDLAGSDLSYVPGDCIGVIPENDPAVVQQLLGGLEASGLEEIQDARNGDVVSLREFLARRANISRVSKKLAQLIQPDSTFSKEDLAAYHVWDFVRDEKQLAIDLQAFCEKLGRLIPRLYSIASSQSVVRDHVDLTVALTQYCTRQEERRGVCTQYLLHSIDVGAKVPIYIQPTKHFLLPEDSTKPIIMVGPGTGVAPFRGFLQERVSSGGRGSNWLFFGDWHANSHFYYGDYFKSLQGSGELRLSLAWSRDQSHKVYVQDRMYEERKELWQWLQDGAHFYVCGDASRMAKDVKAMLIRIASEEGGMSEDEAKGYVEELRKAKRYLVDAY